MGRHSELGELEQMVLLAVWRLGEGAYGLAVRDEVERRAGRWISVSTAYLTLVRLEDKRLLRSHTGDAAPIRGGKAKRFFTITERGVTAVSQARDRMDRMWDGLRPNRSVRRG